MKGDERITRAGRDSRECLVAKCGAGSIILAALFMVGEWTNTRKLLTNH
jgi:hypothetical protein|tara:strand:+ start:4650 stop:4796 length:147 start_codon:yes stop_codon:yes gene_type:complete